MINDPVDIIVPVWNHPHETRACLVSLIDSSSDIRLILVDNSCDSETEQMLGEFAEALDIRALYLKNRLNEGFVKAVNRGLSRAESRYVAIIRQNSIVRSGWLEPLRDFMNENSDAGIVVPRYSDKQSKKMMPRRCAISSGIELSHADFAGCMIRSSLIDAVGNFSEEMDGGFWCLKDYSRRALRGGFRTCVVSEGVVEKNEELTLGCLTRRVEHEQQLRARFKESWGEENAYCIYLPKRSDLSCLNDRLKFIAASARQGNRIMLAAHPAIEDELVRVGFNQVHEHISITRLSRLMPARSARKAIAGCSVYELPLNCVSWTDGIPFPGETGSMSFEEFEGIVIDIERKYYWRNI